MNGEKQHWAPAMLLILEFAPAKLCFVSETRFKNHFKKTKKTKKELAIKSCISCSLALSFIKSMLSLLAESDWDNRHFSSSVLAWFVARVASV